MSADGGRRLVHVRLGCVDRKVWPKVLEASLRLVGFSVEVANLGFPGANPADYAAVAEQAVPMLKPDLVIVGALQGDDLASVGAGPRIGAAGKGSVRSIVDPIARALYPNLMAVLDSRRYRTSALPPSSINAVWADQVRDILAGLSIAEKAKYAQMDSAIRRAFESGNLNPSIISGAIRRPEYFIETFDLERSQTQGLVRQMSIQFSRLLGSAASEKAAVIVLSVPFGLYVSKQQFDTRQNGFGFTLDRGMLTSSSPDDAIQRAAAGAGLPFFAFTQAFRATDGAALFFGMDGHFNASGHRLFAEQLTPVVAATLQALPTGCRN